jgi:heme-degrading monooxygenase HmoA
LGVDAGFLRVCTPTVVLPTVVLSEAHRFKIARGLPPRMGFAPDAAHVEQPQPLTAEGCVSMQPYGVRPDHAIRVGFEQQFAANAEELRSPDARTYMLLRRRNDVEMYGKIHDNYDEQTTPDYAEFIEYVNADLARGADVDDVPMMSEPLSESPLLWDPTLVLRAHRRELDRSLKPGVPLFLASNRFPVLSDCALLFEERWASRSSQLSGQPGFLGFALLRRHGPLGCVGGEPEVYSYCTTTLWASQDAWSAWREGGGKNAHAASKNDPKRTPVSEWMAGPASPIFYDVPIYSHRSGVTHVCAPEPEEVLRGSVEPTAGAATGSFEGARDSEP